MNKTTIITAILTIVSLSGLAKTIKTIKSPETMASINVSPGNLTVQEVIMTDTATTVRFMMQYPTEQSFLIVKKSYLQDEDGNRYMLHCAEGIALDKWIKSSGVTEFTMHFEPLPQNVQMFDFIEGDERDAFMLLGIHDKKWSQKTPTIEQLHANNPYILPADWLRTDTVTIRGSIEDYDAERMGFSAMESYAYDVTKEKQGTMLMEVNPDGTFEKQILLSYPMKLSFYISENSNVGFLEIPFFARPGETIDITLRPNEHGKYDCFYNSGSSHEVERWLKSNLRLKLLSRSLSAFQGTFSDANNIAEQVWQNMLTRIDIISRRKNFTPMEMHLALGEMQSIYALALLDYARSYEDRLQPWQQHEDGSWTRVVTDSVELRTISDIKNYKALQHVDFDNPLLLVDDSYYFTVNRIKNAMPVRNVEMKPRSLEKTYALLRELMGSQHDNMMAQLCALNEMENSFNDWRLCEEEIPHILADTTLTEEEKDSLVAADSNKINKCYPVFLTSFTHPYIHQKAEQFYQEKMAQSELSSPLPEGPGIEIIRDIIAKYPNRYLIIDFWGMGCGGCIFGIQGSKNLRAELAKRDDVKLIFIAGERTAEGSKAYKDFVAEWLADEETICVTNEDFRRLQELFQFNYIPHNETITPNGRRVREDIQIHGFDHFDIELHNLKEKMRYSNEE